eukprot:m.239449 g.239449  ORF g.239449 m.239449 type:complete len:55 (+) comp13937_c0_seq12:717-881(+)
MRWDDDKDLVVTHMNGEYSNTCGVEFLLLPCTTDLQVSIQLNALFKRFGATSHI